MITRNRQWLAAALVGGLSAAGFGTALYAQSAAQGAGGTTVRATSEPGATLFSADTFAPVASFPVAGQNAYGYFSPQSDLAFYVREDPRLEQESQATVKQLVAAEKEADKDKLRGKLKEVLEKQFDAQQKQREEEVTRIEKQLEKLKETIRKRSEVKGKIVERRMEQMILDAQGLGWQGGSSRARNATSWTLPATPVAPPAPALAPTRAR